MEKIPQPSASGPDYETEANNLNAWGTKLKMEWLDKLDSASLAPEHAELLKGIILDMPDADPLKVRSGYGKKEYMEAFRNRFIDLAHPRMSQIQNQLDWERMRGVPANASPEERRAAEVYEYFLEDSKNKANQVT